ncbi:MAG: hypothetical protein V4533_10660 [Pseudomonadota bacterium]|jgi:alginate biosynthesis protein Alg44|uniref:hypothetical protein n=1 Tax=Sphingobium sp. CECT 9361 TaxID=2845384 RepID=UPI001E6095D0|nr:hypothetical protein [Sphingobium sp. CECT 9361]CAH0349333.1 Mannuronan synthase [Sphingobium sp. CECT 9361]|tara:strand:+ start:4669 stop:5760 length:1092 start_codon:yes stop_codon:yes gene_type:complete
MSTAATISHEAASQRQHTRMKVAAEAIIDGKVYPTFDWSVGGVCIKDYDESIAVGDILLPQIRFNFDGFDMTIDVELAVRHISADGKTIGGAFSQMSWQQLSLLHYVRDAYLSGEVVDAGDMLHVIQRDNSARVRSSSVPEEEKTPRRALFDALSKNFGLLLFVVAAATLCAYVAVNLYTRTFVVAAEGAVTSPSGTVLRSPSSATVTSFAVKPGDKVEPNQILASMERIDGSILNVVSNCRCVVGERLAQLGTPLSRAAPIISLAPLRGKVESTLVVRLKDLRKVSVGDRVAINFFNDDTEAMGRVKSILLPGLTDPETLERTGLRVPDLAGSVVVAFDTPINAARIGQPVSGRVRTLRFGL